MSRSSRTVVAFAVLALFVASPLRAGAAPRSLAEGTSRTPSKIAYILLDTIRDARRIQAQAHRAEQAGSPHVPSVAKASNTFVHVRPNASIEVLVHSAAPASRHQIRQLQRLGATGVSTAHGAVQLGLDVGMTDAWLPIDRVAAVAALSWVVAVTPPSYGFADAGTGNTVSQGVTLHRANTVQDVRGITGTGVTVGVSSDGVTNLAASQGFTPPELPAVTVDDAGSGDEGTAMLEIVADMAPGAALVFDATSGLTDYVNSLTNLASKTNVIAEDLSFDAEPAFQRGAGAQAGDTIAAGGVSVHSSAGNRAQNHVARVTATGTGTGPDGVSYTATPTGCANAPDNVVDIDPGPGTAFDLQLGASGTNGTAFTLQWSEPRAIFPTAGQGGFTDLNLYVMNTALTQCLGQSVGVQGNGQGDTIEQIAMPSGSAGTNVKVVVDLQGSASAAAAPLIDLRWRNDNSQADTTTAAGSLNPDSNYTGGLANAVAAVDAQNAGALEGYSSQGPVQIVSTTVCTAGDPPPCVGVAGPAEQDFQQPTWAAADDVVVSGVGSFPSPFTGTSAAAPSAAGCEALLRSSPQSTPTASPASTNARLIATATAPATPNVTGAGTLDCLAAVNRPPVANAGGPYSTSEGVNIPLNANASSDPDTGDTLTFAWDLDNNGSFEAPGATPTFDLVGQDGSFPVKVRVTDGAGATATAGATVTISNVAPTIAFAATSPVVENSPTSIVGTVTDPGWLDPLSATIDFGDGGGAQPLPGTSTSTPHGLASLAFSTTHVYGDNSSDVSHYAVKICGSDDDTTTCLSHVVTVSNVPPEAHITAPVPPAFFHAGDNVAFTGTSLDPGSDDRSTKWDFDDGTIVTSTSFNNGATPDPPNSPQVNPRTVTDAKSHVFTACLYNVKFSATDDDGGASPVDSINVVIRGNATRAEDSGYWKKQLDQKNNAELTAATLNCYLKITGFLSAVFDEQRIAATIPAAINVIDPKNFDVRVKEFDRELLTAWLNFANGAVDFTDTVKGDNHSQITFAAEVALAEALRANPATTKQQLDDHRQVLNKFNHLKDHH